tara:strand:- start:25 stop:2181 length:2157 start_codon:yes stop_codon:yes gene_type:complete
MANLRTNNLSGEQGQNAYRGAVFFEGARSFLYMGEDTLIGSATGFGTNDFTIEFWINQGVNSSNYTIIFTLHTTTAKGFEVAFHSGTIQIYTDTGAWRDTGYAPRSGVYEHIAFVRNYSGNTLKMYVNGVEKYSVSNSVNYSDNFDYVQIGSYDVAAYGYLEGYLSNFRILNGTALYTTNYFTPPTSELKAIPDTILLCCQDSNDPTQEATGKTITAVGGHFQTGNNNILKNGDFSQGTDGFSGDSGASISESGGVMTVTNGGGDNLYALKQERCLRIGGKYRCTATITPTFASGNPVFRVRFGGDAVSFTQPQATMSTGVAVRIDTGEKVADGENFEIGSGDSSGITQFTVTDLVVTAIDPPIPPKVIPPFGVDAGNAFGGPIQQSSQGYMCFPTGSTEERGAGLGIVAGGYSAATSPIDTIESIRIQTMGNSIPFGTLNAGRFSFGAVASTSRVIFGGGYQPSNLNSMEFVNPITQGNGTDAGDLSAARKFIAGLGNSTRGIFAGGNEPAMKNTIEFVTIPSLGDAVDFGDLTAAVNNPRGCASPTRGIVNCATAPTSRSNVINFITIASTGDAQDFGDMTETFGMTGFGLSDNTRGVIGGYYTSPSNTNVNTINFVTIATTGDATDFGDMVTGTGHGGCGFSDRTRGVITGQYTNTPHGDAPLYADGQGAVNLIQMITVQTTGNAIEFGDLVANAASNGRKYYANGNSNSHGGLS